MEAEGRLTEGLSVIKVFDSVHGNAVLAEVAASLAADCAHISLGVKLGHMVDVHPADDEAGISRWIEEASPKLLGYVACDSARFKRLGKRALERESKRESKKRTFRELVKGTVNDWKEGVKRTFNIGSQMRRKEKTLRYSSKQRRKHWIRVLHLLSNGALSTAALFSEDQRLDVRSSHVVDFALSPSKDELAVVHTTSVVYVYSLKTCSTFLIASRMDACAHFGHLKGRPSNFVLPLKLLPACRMWKGGTGDMEKGEGRLEGGGGVERLVHDNAVLA